ncbi:MAG: hypothetical protein ABJC74_00910 [Gemmatimonadota bacterium]
MLTSLVTPEPALNQRFESAREIVRVSPPDALAEALRIPALLAIGDHGAALDRLRALRPLTGTNAVLRIDYARWSGDPRWLARLGADGLRDVSGAPAVPNRDPEGALRRWRGAAGELTPLLAAQLVLGAVVSIWGVMPNAADQAVAIEPTFPAEWKTMALRNLRIGETLLALSLRRNRNGAVLDVQRTRGPGIRITFTMSGVEHFEVDGEPLGGGRAVFRAEGVHEVTMRA